MLFTKSLKVIWACAHKHVFVSIVRYGFVYVYKYDLWL